MNCGPVIRFRQEKLVHYGGNPLESDALEASDSGHGRCFPGEVVFLVSREFRWAPKPIELDPVRHFLQITGLLRISFI
jgi:hypothetical protein